MFKTDAQLSEVVSLAKAFYYEDVQRISEILQTHIDTKRENVILENSSRIRNIIKAMDFIGANNEDNNRLEEKLQEMIQRPDLMNGYVEQGYVESGYVKPNNIP